MGIADFAGSAIDLPFFELTKGILMVSDHELGYTPSTGALAMSSIVELASGAQVHILGVIDTAYTMI